MSDGPLLRNFTLDIPDKAPLKMNRRNRNGRRSFLWAFYPLVTLGVIILIPTSPVVVPLLLWSSQVDEKERQIAYGERRSHPPPRGIYYKSKRERLMALMGSKDKMNTPASPILQTDSLLLNLPFEIREMIWNYCVGGSWVHLRPLGSRPCTCSSSTFCEYDYPCEQPKDKITIGRTMSLFLTCHQMYSETAPFFYTTNEFRTATADNVEFLPRLLPRHRIDSIRSFHFVFWLANRDPPLPPRPGTSKLRKSRYFRYNLWCTIWANLASMKGLRELRVKLRFKPVLWRPMTADEAIVLLAPIMRVTTPEFFELSVPFACDGAEMEPWRRLPCRVKQYGPIAN